MHGYERLEEMKLELTIVTIKYYSSLVLTFILFFLVIIFFILGSKTARGNDIAVYIPFVYWGLAFLSAIFFFITKSLSEKYSFLHLNLYAKVKITEAVIVRGQASLDLLEEIERTFPDSEIHQ